MTKRERQAHEYAKEAYGVELLGGPFDGLIVAVAQETSVLLLRDGSRLHRYDWDEQHLGFSVRSVFRHTQTTRT